MRQKTKFYPYVDPDGIIDSLTDYGELLDYKLRLYKAKKRYNRYTRIKNER